MALLHSETTPATGANALFTLKELLKSAGHAVASSSDGTTYFAATDGITSGNSGAGGLANNTAWFRLVMDDGQEYVFQRGTTNLVWRIKHSRAAGFTGGSPSATRVPSATDEAIFWGGGTDASPTFSALLGTDNTYRWKAVADDSAPYGWWCGGIPIGGGNPTGCIVHDPLVGTHPSDQSKMVCFVAQTTNAFSSGSIVNETGSTGSFQVNAYRAATTGGAFTNIGGNYPGNGVGNLVVLVGAGGMGANPIDAFDDGVPILFGRRAAIANPGWKGVGTFMRWHGTVRATGQVGAYSGGAYRLVMRDVTLPWPIATCEV